MVGKQIAETGQSSGRSEFIAVEEEDEILENHGEEEEEDEEEDDDDGFDSRGDFVGFVPSPLVTLKHHIEKDKDDESLRRWKEKLLGCLGSNLIDQMESEVNFQSIRIISKEDGEFSTITLSDDASGSGSVFFSLRQGSHYQFKLMFTVKHNIVSGLTYSNKVWKGGFPVDRTKKMLGTFAPQREPYVQLLDEETAPSGVLARGLYSARLKLEDDDRRCYMKLSYTFEIKRAGS